jgi:FAD/FMN-containing dehydrogenase
MPPHGRSEFSPLGGERSPREREAEDNQRRAAMTVEGVCMFSHRFTRRIVVASGSALLAWAMPQATPAQSLLRAPSRSSSDRLSGRVIWPRDPAYAEARLSFNARFSRFPAAIVVCDNTTDVQNAVRWARQEVMPLRARSGGHSYEAFSVVDDGLVIDVGGLTGVDVDVSRGEAVVGAGVRLLDGYRRLWEHGVTIPAGTCPGVGIAGLTLGGGIGFLSRQHGLTCDNLVAIELVDAEGRTLRASEEQHPDLFWAMRGGGGGNFGIATAFTFRVHPIGDVVLCTVTWPWDDVPEVFDAWQRWAPFTDERLSVALAVAHPSAGTISATGLFTGAATELPSLLGPLLQAGTPGAPVIQSLPYFTAVEQLGGPPMTNGSLRFKNSSAIAYEPLPAAAITTLVDHLRAAPFDSDLVGFFPLGGAVAAIDPATTAFPHRRAHFDLQFQAYWWDDAAAAASLAWVRDVRTAMVPYTTGAYVNYIDADLPDWESAYYGTNLARLERVKKDYDPDDVFNGPQSIPSSSH